MTYRLLFGGLAAAAALHAGEPSAYGAGDLAAKSPYGLTPSEQQIVANKQAIDQIRARLDAIEQAQKGISEAIEGMRSLIEGNAQQVGSVAMLAKRTEDLNSSLTHLSTRLDDNLKLQNDNADKTSKAIADLGRVIDDLNATYVTRAEWNAAGNGVKALRTKEGPAAPSVEAMQKSDKGVLLRQGIAAFDAGDNETAGKIFTFLGTTGYKSDAVWYYRGELAYRAGDDRAAVEAYQKSLDKNSASPYAPTILLHTAKALERSGDSKGASKVYDVLIGSFPASKEAKEAKKSLGAKR